VVIWYIFPHFGILHQEKSGNSAPKDDSEDDPRTGRRADESRHSCWETSTLDEEAAFPVTEVATAAAVSTSTTFFVAVVCCCCFPSLCKKKTADKSKKKAEDSKEAAGKVAIFQSPFLPVSRGERDL
jgi:hypothetical protein